MKQDASVGLTSLFGTCLSELQCGLGQLSLWLGSQFHNTDECTTSS
uniref:Uncharacterized protein n=1 Tax=Anguilla anguilla TaxID=7936 RepID=A0A0E9RVV5_ANGAN